MFSSRTRWKIERWFKKLGASSSGESDQPRPKLCPSCRTLVGATATTCHNCGSSMRFSMAAANQSLARYLPQTSPVTYTVMTACFAIFLATSLVTIRESGFQSADGGLFGMFGFGAIRPDVLLRAGQSLPLPYNLIEPWRFVTAIFLHANILHILFNMWVLMDIGPMLEETYGSARYFFIFVVTGIGGYVASSAVGHLSVGASGSLLGLMGVLLAVTYGSGSAGAVMMRQNLIRWLIYIAILGLVMRGTDNWAHGGGLVTGFILGKLMSDRAPATPEQRKLANAMGWGTALVVIASFAMILLNISRGRI